MSLATLLFHRLLQSSRLFAGEMPPSLLPQWQWLIIYLVLIVVVASLLIINAAASSTEQGAATHATPGSSDEHHATSQTIQPETKSTHADDLKIIEGIGPKIASVLQAAGINGFAQLSETDPARLEAILQEAGLHLADPATWPEQARLAAAGDWTAFDALTARLKGGRAI